MQDVSVLGERAFQVTLPASGFKQELQLGALRVCCCTALAIGARASVVSCMHTRLGRCIRILRSEEGAVVVEGYLGS